MAAAQNHHAHFGNTVGQVDFGNEGVLQGIAADGGDTFFNDDLGDLKEPEKAQSPM